MSGEFQKITRCGKAKRASKLRTGRGIKAVITLGDLQSVVAAAKKWQAHCVEEGEPASKLLHHIANAEAVLMKYKTRNRLAFEYRENRRREEAEETGEPLPPPKPVRPAEEPRFGTKVWNALDALGFHRKAADTPAATTTATGKEAARPTRWRDMEESKKKTCGNCFTIQPHSATHVVCLNDGCKSCGCLKSVNSAGCKKWSGGAK